MKLKTALCAAALALSSSFITMPAAMAQEVIQTQYGPDMVEVDLIRAEVHGDVLSVAFIFRNMDDSKSITIGYPIEDVSYIDDVHSKKYLVLKDDKGEWLAGPISDALTNEGKETRFRISSNGRNVVWYKFPAPPAEANSLMIELPDVSPFDGVEVER